MMKRFLFLAFVACLSPISAEEPPALYPFEVTLGGQKAETKQNDDLFAVVAQPVKSDAVLAIAEKSALLIVNAFPCKEDGSVLMDTPAAIIFGQDTKEVKLDQTIDKKKLAPGTYLMNVVAHQKTSRVVFTITDGTAKPSLPSLSKIVDFLKKR